ncbi:hypothetical protein E2C01_031904 [Portunus trituberculatus]|uniref:Uncharacterized protein n=1 Tax=Portunus trituberculatus TaxID=210409 RepID=A0A5B7EYX1_PORTR|nr:hypothetical protein [Portunus trituberculatus]
MIPCSRRDRIFDACNPGGGKVCLNAADAGPVTDEGAARSYWAIDAGGRKGASGYHRKQGRTRCSAALPGPGHLRCRCEAWCVIPGLEASRRMKWHVARVRDGGDARQDKTSTTPTGASMGGAAGAGRDKCAPARGGHRSPRTRLVAMYTVVVRTPGHGDAYSNSAAPTHAACLIIHFSYSLSFLFPLTGAVSETRVPPLPPLALHSTATATATPTNARRPVLSCHGAEHEGEISQL